MPYPFQIEIWMQPLLLPFGATQSESFATIEGSELHVKMGKLFDETLDITQIESVEHGKWPILGGLGHRVGLKKDMAVLGSTKNVIKIHFKTPQTLKALGPVYLQINDFYLALQNPEEFINDLSAVLE